MVTSVAAEDRIVRKVKRLSNAGLDQRALLSEVAECLRDTIPSEAFCYSATDPSSTPLLLKRRVQPLELYARITRSEAPLDLDARSIAPFLPGRGFPFEGLEVRNPPLEALAA
jgi:hypothetical protein